MTDAAQATPNGYYVYIHRRESDLSVFYVGKGFGRRAWGTTGRNRWWKHVVSKHGGYRVQIVKAGLSEPCALTLERVIIYTIKARTDIVNLVDGGGGTPGWRHSEETKAKIGAFSKGRRLSQKALAALKKYNTEKIVSEETRRRQSAAAAVRNRAPHSEETRAKIAAAHLGLRPSPEALRKMSEAKIGKAVGKSSPSYDHTIRRFSHPGHGVFEGTRGDLILNYGLSAGDMSAMLSGKQKSVRGWRVA